LFGRGSEIIDAYLLHRNGTYTKYTSQIKKNRKKSYQQNKTKLVGREIHPRVVTGQNLKLLMALGRSGNLMSFICWGRFMFLTADTARAGAAARPA